MSNAGGIKVIAPNTSGAVVTITNATTGQLPVIYSDAALTTAIAIPTSLAAGGSQTFYFTSPGSYTMSVKYGSAKGIEIAYLPNRTFTFDISPGQLPVYDYSLTPAPSGNTGTVLNGATPNGIMDTGMIPAVSGNHCYPIPSSGTLWADGGLCTIEQRVALTDLTEVRMIIANRYFTSVDPVESDGPNSVIQRHSISYPAGTLKYTAGSTAWSAATAYVVGDQVTLSSNSYVCKVNNTNSTPVVNGTANWDQVGFYPLHFPGEGANRDVTLQPGQHLISDPIAIDIKAGKSIALRSVVQPNNGTPNTGSYPTGFALQAFGGDWFTLGVTGSSPGTDYTLSDPTTTATATSAHAGGAGVLIGRAANVTGKGHYLGTTGDSLVAGSGDASQFNSNEPGGWWVRSINRQYPYIRAAHTGDTLTGFSRPGASQHRRSFIGDPDVYLSELVTNDMTTTLATLQAYKLAEWAYYKNRGSIVVAVLVQPRTTSTDSFATSVNQTDVSGWATAGTSNRDAYNDWIRSKPAGVDYVLDWLSAVETAPKSNRWRNAANGDGGTVYTTDGTHPTNFGCLAIAAVAGPVLSQIMSRLP